MSSLPSSSSPLSFVIQVPASTANLGPGFDTLGLGLSLYLTLTVSVHPNDKSPDFTLTDQESLGQYVKSHIKIVYDGDSSVALNPLENLITQVAFFVANAYHQVLPPCSIHIQNPIPLGRGLGSSGSAVVAGVALANQLLRLELSHDQILDYAVLIEGHPDNVAASVLGGFVTSFVRKPLLSTLESWFVPGNKQVPRLHSASTGDCLTRYTKLPFSSSIKVVVVIPDFQLATSKARSVLPEMYARKDVISNLQRLSSLTHALGAASPDASLISECLQDTIHQPYRMTLVPGLEEMLQLNQQHVPGLLGVCLSGAGPTVLSFATALFDSVGEVLIGCFSKHNIPCRVHTLDVDHHGLVVSPLLK